MSWMSSANLGILVKWIFDGLMCHITNGKVKTSMLLIWASSDGEDIYGSFNLPPHQANAVQHVLQQFEEFCEPICNFRAARFKFTKVSQQQGEAINTFYNRMLKLAQQCEFSDINKWLIDAIIFGTTSMKAQDKLLQMPRTLSLQECLTVFQHYNSLQLHIQQIQPGSDKYIKFLKKCHPKSKKPTHNQNQNNLKPRSNTKQRSQQSAQQQKSNKRKCYGWGHDFHKDWVRECLAWGSTCTKCSKPNHWENMWSATHKKTAKSRASQKQRKQIHGKWD